MGIKGTVYPVLYGNIVIVKKKEFNVLIINILNKK